MEVKSGEGTVVVADHRDQNIINSVVQALGNKTA